MLVRSVGSPVTVPMMGVPGVFARIEDARVVILVVRVGHRREVYR